MAKEETKEETLTVHVLYSQDRTGDREERTCNYTTHFKGAVVTATGQYPRGDLMEHFQVPKAAFEKPRSVVYAVVGYYSDGDTFGHSSGYIHIVDVYGNMEKAYAVADLLRQDSQATNDSIFGSRHFPWGGYFASLDSIDVVALPILSLDTGDTATTTKNHKDIPSW